MSRLAIVGVSATLTLMVLEGCLHVMKSMKGQSALGRVAMPGEFDQRLVNVPGAARAYYWQGKLHVYNRSGFRNLGDYAADPKKTGIVVLGDSLTYGTGVGADETYSADLERLLNQTKRRVKVFNLGIPGLQSADMIFPARDWIPVLKPKVVIYGICLNDFLPSGVGQYENNWKYKLPLPDALTAPFEERTELGVAMTRAYNQLLMATGLRNDFYGDILKDFTHYQERFQADLTALNALVVKQTGFPVIAMVLDQGPSSTRGRQIARVAEAAAKKAGMDVIPTDAYYDQYSKVNPDLLHVSVWEGHPSAMLHRVWAEMMAARLEHDPRIR